MAFVLALVVAAGATALVARGFYGVRRLGVVPRLARPLRLCCAVAGFAAGNFVLLVGAMAGLGALRGWLAAAAGRPAASDDAMAQLLMMGLILPCVLAAYLLTMRAYAWVYRGRDELQPHADWLRERQARDAQEDAARRARGGHAARLFTTAAAPAARFAAIQAAAHHLFCLLFFLSAGLAAYGLTH